MKYGLILICLFLNACAGQPTSPSFAEFNAQYESLKQKQPERVVFDFGASCDDQGLCLVNETRLVDAANVITKLNDTVESLVNVANDRVSAIQHCSYASALKDESIRYMESASMRQDATNTAKQILGGLTCMGLLWAK